MIKLILQKSIVMWFLLKMKRQFTFLTKAYNSHFPGKQIITYLKIQMATKIFMEVKDTK